MKSAITIFILALILAIVGPIATIWALNTLFPQLAIPLNIWTYLAVAVLQVQLIYKGPSK